MKYQRRSSDRRVLGDRRTYPGHSATPTEFVSGYRYPPWQEQKIQFFTRYIFLLLGFLFFNAVEGIAPTHWSLLQLNTVLGLYLLSNSLLFLHARQHNFHTTRFHLAMWVDIIITSVCVLNDPYPIPPSLLVFIMVVLGNGMRYGMRMFAESLIGCFTAAMLVLSARYLIGGATLSPGLVFLNLFGAISLVYSYILMERIDRNRRELELRSNLDILTGLLNRRALLDVVNTMFQRLHRNNRKFAMLFADLDKFKAVNDELGHAAGDLVLKQFAEIIRNSIRSPDIAARFGGDEFIMLLENTSPEDAEYVATRIQHQVNSWAKENGIDVSVTFGLGEAPTHGDNFHSLLEQVDRALYHSKTTHAGGGLAHAQCRQAVS
jgi:diguanylate cyclase (GGDEF)-like protein